MPKITVTSALPDPQAVVVAPLHTVLSGYAERADFALTVSLGVGGSALGVPVRVDVLGRDAQGASLAMHARKRTDWFPVFNGTIRVEPHGPMESRLYFAGEYEVPLGAVGLIVNRRVLNGAAERSLRAFAERLRSDVIDEVRRSELDVRPHALDRA